MSAITVVPSSPTHWLTVQDLELGGTYVDDSNDIVLVVEDHEDRRLYVVISDGHSPFCFRYDHSDNAHYHFRPVDLTVKPSLTARSTGS